MKGTLKFLLPHHSKEYIEKGYFINHFIGREDILRLEAVFHKYFDLASLPEVFDTIATPPVSVIEKVNEEINDICFSSLNGIVENYRIVCSIFFIKKPGGETELSLHIDPSMTLQNFNNVGVWIPLCDIDENTGRICLLDGSQNFLPSYNSPTMPSPYSQVENLVVPHMSCLSLKLGEALFFNNSMLHYTQKNISTKTRIAVVIKLIDKEAPLVTAFYNESAEIGQQIQLFENSENFFISGKFRLATPPEDSRFLGYIAELPKIFTATEFQELIK